jgi:hypothetical protein
VWQYPLGSQHPVGQSPKLHPTHEPATQLGCGAAHEPHAFPPSPQYWALSSVWQLADESQQPSGQFKILHVLASAPSKCAKTQRKPRKTTNPASAVLITAPVGSIIFIFLDSMGNVRRCRKQHAPSGRGCQLLFHGHFHFFGDFDTFLGIAGGSDFQRTIPGVMGTMGVMGVTGGM